MFKNLFRRSHSPATPLASIPEMQTLSAYQLAAKAAGEVLVFDVDCEKLTIPVDAVLSAIMGYFQVSDKILFRIFPESEALHKICDSESANNWSGSIPEIQWFKHQPDQNNRETVSVHELLQENSGQTVWSILYGRYLAFFEPLTMYENSQVSRKYDSVKALENNDADTVNLATFNGPYDANFLRFIDEMNIRSVLDLGCGAGAFWHLLSKRYGADFGYKGFDYARTQIYTAIRNFGSERFDVKDISNIPVEVYNAFDAVHCYSVFPFMSKRKQLKTLKTMLSSNSQIFIDLTVTLDDEFYMPQAFFKNFAKLETDGAKVMTPVSFLLFDEVQALFAPFADRYSLYTQPIAYNNKYLPNPELIEESILVSSDYFKANHIKPPRDAQALTVAIVPKNWELVAGEYKLASAENAAEQQLLIKQYLSRMAESGQS